MKTYVALLRGINVGGNNKVAMSELKAEFEALGYGNVRTYINSGNVIFDSSSDDFESIRPKLSERFGFEVRLVIVPVELFNKLIEKTPADWRNDKQQKTDVLFLWPGYDDKQTLQDLELIDEYDTAIYVDGAIVWNIDRANQSKSRMQKGYISSDIYKNMTARNINTVRKIASLV